MEKKRCPLLGKNKDGIVEVCGEEKCAWWINRTYHHETGCALSVIAQAIAIINRDGIDVLTRSGG